MTLAMNIRLANYTNAVDQAALLTLLDMYARDPMGGGEPLSESVRAGLCEALHVTPGAHSWIAWVQEQPVGLLNAFIGFSTFKAKPLLNIHDLAVQPDWRGRGVGRALLNVAQERAEALGCCKLTLEVLCGNHSARRTYEAFGFENYVLNPEVGDARLMQKPL